MQPFLWQREEVLPSVPYRWTLLVCARQSGKTQSVATKMLHRGKFHPGSVCLSICPSKEQAEISIRRVAEMMLRDITMPSPRYDNVFSKEWASGSRIKALPGSERAVRGESAPDIIYFDEAARVPDDTYAAVTPMTTNTPTEVIATSTAFGRRGWFYRAWSNPKAYWRKVLVRIPWDPVDGVLVDAMPEEEFRAYWAERGVHAYYSERHNKWEVQRDLDEQGELWVRQEYCCEFLEDEVGIFRHDDIVRMFSAGPGEIFAEYKPEVAIEAASGGAVIW